MLQRLNDVIHKQSLQHKIGAFDKSTDILNELNAPGVLLKV